MVYLVEQPLTNYSAIKHVIRRSKKYSPVVAVAGNTQSGKSLFSGVFCKDLSMYRFKKKWDYKKNTCLSIKQFIKLVSNSQNEVIAIEEGSFQLSSKRWYELDALSTFDTLTTQAFRRNIYVIIAPHMKNVASDTRFSIDFQFVIQKKYESIKSCYVLPQQFSRRYWDITKKHFIVRYPAPFFNVYSDKEMVFGKEYTDWLEKEYKKETAMEKIKERYGLEEPFIPPKPFTINR